MDRIAITAGVIFQAQVDALQRPHFAYDDRFLRYHHIVPESFEVLAPVRDSSQNTLLATRYKQGFEFAQGHNELCIWYYPADGAPHTVQKKYLN